MAGLNVLIVLLILVSGYAITKSLPSLKRNVLRTNGQQLTFISATAGLIIFSIFYWLFSIPDEAGSSITQLLRGNTHPSMIHAAFWTFATSVVLSMALKLPGIYYEYMLSESLMKVRVSQFVKKNISDSNTVHIISIANKLHWHAYRYVSWSSKKIIKGDAAEEMYFGSFFQESNGLCMFVLESKKAVIGLVTGMPDYTMPKSERYVRVLPYFTGHLCDGHLQLHITTDYTHYIEEQHKGELHQTYSFDVILPSDGIKYVREFDVNFFKNNFLNKQCPCGHFIYNTSVKQRVSVSSERVKGFRHRC